MEYLIDGYNLLFSFLPEIYDIDRQRFSMLSYLHDKIGSRRDLFTFVFDGSFTQNLHFSREYYGTFLLHFTPKNISADRYITEELIWKKRGTELTVISSDQRLIRECKERGTFTQSAFDFFAWIDRKGIKSKPDKPVKDGLNERARLEKLFLERLKIEREEEDEDD